MSVNFLKKKDGYDISMCPIATVRLDGFSPTKITKLIDYSNDVHENSENYVQTQIILADRDGAEDTTPISGFPLTYYETTFRYKSTFFVTDKVNDNNDPLYFSYELKFDVNGVTDTDIIEVLKNNTTPLRPDQFKLQFGHVSLTDNYYGTKDAGLDRYGRDIVWGPIDGSKNIHRVRVLLPIDVVNRSDFYTVRYNKSLFNISYPAHFELIELTTLYTETIDWDIQEDKVVLPTTSFISNVNTKQLYITKDPNAHIAVEGVISMNAEGYQSDAESSWNARISHGSFLTNLDERFYQAKFVPIDVDNPQEKYQLITYVNPKLLGGNIVRIEDAPIHITTVDDLGSPSGYVYPYYDVTIFPKESFDNIIPIGTFGIDVDGVDVSRIKISSIDRQKGYILFNKQFNPQEDVDFFFYTDCSSKSYIYNLELNPRISGEYGISHICENTIKNIGVAVRESPEVGVGDSYTNRLRYHSLYFFDYEAVADDGQVTFYRGNQIPGLSTYSEVGYLRWNPFDGKESSTGQFIPLSHVSVNRMFPDILTVRDARIIAGGFTSQEQKRLNNEQKNSYTDIGYWDGEPLPHAGLIVIHLPSTIYPNLITKWKESGLFNPDMYTDITKEEIEQLAAASGEDYDEYYSKLLEGYSVNNEKVKDPYETMLTSWAKKEASHYLDQLIKKYIPAGTQYILLDENFNQIKLDL